MTRIALLCLLRVYKLLVSPLVSRKLRCRFHPTCSDYARIAIEQYGAAQGVRMALGRWLRCRPDNRESCIDFP
jgi:putative membrane protein insertion efficiency factor